MKKRDDEDSIFLNDIQNDKANRERKERRVTKIHERMPCVGETARTHKYREETREAYSTLFKCRGWNKIRE